jgi:hypothetical protein
LDEGRYGDQILNFLEIEKRFKDFADTESSPKREFRFVPFDYCFANVALERFWDSTVMCGYQELQLNS